MTEEKEECIFCTVKICGKARTMFLELKSFEVKNGRKVSNNRILKKLISFVPDSVLNQYIGGKK